MKEHVNFYENIQEAQKRLDGTVVKYDGDYYYVLCVTDHKNDGIFRVYLDPLSKLEHMRIRNTPHTWYDDGENTRGKMMDEYLKEHKDTHILRKHMNSPLFGKFRPFPLGMVNTSAGAYYCERSPMRPHTQQGLTNQMVFSSFVSLGKGTKGFRGGVSTTTEGFYAMLMGQYPTFDECLTNLCDPSIENESAAFSDQFAVVRGPVDTLFLSYKTEVVGLLDGKQVLLSRDFLYLKEVLEESGKFEAVVTKG